MKTSRMLSFSIAFMFMMASIVGSRAWPVLQQKLVSSDLSSKNFFAVPVLPVERQTHKNLPAVTLAVTPDSPVVTHGEARREQLGIMTQDMTPELAQTMGLDGQAVGVIVAKVEPSSAAEQAGIIVGDVITDVDKATVRDTADLRNRIGLLRIGDTAELMVMRAGESVVIPVLVATPAKTLVKGSDINHMLDGVTFGSSSDGVADQGAEIVSVDAASKAANAGMREADVIVSVNQLPVAKLEDFVAKVKGSRDHLLLNVVRGDNAIFVILQ